MKPLIRLLVLTGIFAVAMAFLESAVVVYLREIYYPEGFAFPLKMIEGTVGITEILREAATLVMLLFIALLAARSFTERFAWFIFAFAIWDIFYYVFLFLLLGWPPSLYTWDILFLIPVPWTGPVLAPVLNSLTMILLALLILRIRIHTDLFRLTFLEWLLFILGSLITVFSYAENYLRYLHSWFSVSGFYHPDPAGKKVVYSMMFIPEKFNWPLFALGEILFFLVILLIVRRMKRR